MKICILTPRFPFPENGGDVLRINNIARYLKYKNYNLILVSFCDKKIELKKEYYELYDTIYLVKRKKFVSLIMAVFFALTGKPIQCGYYFSFAFLRKIKQVINKESPDEYISHLLRMATYLKMLKKQNTSIIEMTDALSKTYTLSSNAKGSLIKKCIYRFEKKLIYRYEKSIIKQFPKITLVSASDIKYLQEQFNEQSTKLALYTNGVDTLPSIPDSYKNRKICFVGNMRTLQNQDAVFHFVNDIYPLIKKSIPDVVFTVIGAEPPESIKSLDDGKNITITGFVNDIQTAIAECCIAVAPIRVAAGIQNKVLMAMGCGVPVIMSSLISVAIPELESSTNCFIEDDNIKFADACIKLLEDSNLRNQISKSGFMMVKDNYSWNEKLLGYEIIN